MKLSDKWVTLIKWGIIIIISMLISLVILNKIYKSKHEKFLENGTLPDVVFNFAEYDENTQKYSKIGFEGPKLYQYLKEYLEDYGNKKLFLPKDYEFEDDELSIIEKYSIVEKTKEYQLFEVYSETEEFDITTQYKVFNNGDVVPYYSFYNNYLDKTWVYMSTAIVGLILTFLINFLFMFALKHFKQRKELRKEKEKKE